MSNKLILIAIFFIIGIIILSWNNIYQKFFGSLPEIEKLVNQKIDEIKKEVNTPPPLKAKKESAQSVLTVEGVIKFTNFQRAQNNLPPLMESSILDQSASIKVQ